MIECKACTNYYGSFFLKSITVRWLFLNGKAWLNFHKIYKKRIRQSIIIAIAKLLSCRTKFRGYKQYKCSNEKCNNTMRVPHTCKSKACSSCGKKATSIWIAKQNNILPNCEWQHITFTMPSELWDLFWYNRGLLNKIAKLASDCIKVIADKKDVTPAIFTALHTFGRDLKRNVHVHLSTTRIGLHKSGKKLKKLFFKQISLMKMWKYRIITLFRESDIVVPSSLARRFNNSYAFAEFLNSLYAKDWIVHCSKATSNHTVNVNYLGRYIKRPPIANSKLQHYDGNSVTLKSLDHKTKTFKISTFSIFEFISRFIQHIPDMGFRMIRYYGLLANRVRSKLLPTLYRLLGQNSKGQITFPSFVSLIISNFRYDPMKCPKCKCQMLLSYSVYSCTNTYNLLLNHSQLAANKFS